MLQKQAGGGQEYGEELQQVLPLGDVPLDPQGEALDPLLKVQDGYSQIFRMYEFGPSA